MDTPLMIHLFICWRILGCFQTGAITNKTAMSNCVQVFVWTRAFFSLRWIASCGLTGPHSKCPFNFIRNHQAVFQNVVAFYFPPAAYESFRSLTSPALGLVSLFHFSHSKRYVIILHCGFNLHFLMTNDVEHLFMCLLLICISYSVKCLLKSFVSF